MNALSNLPENAIIFLDIDDTIITPVSKTFRKPPYNNLIDEIKKNQDKYPNYAEIVSNWRLQRQVRLTDESWPLLLAQLQEKFAVYGLTKIDIGTFGNIKSMEKWRYQELKSLGIEFSNRFNIPEGVINGAAFYKSLLMTGVNSKSETICHYSRYLKTNTMVLLDDKQAFLEDVQEFCEKNAIQFVGILFKGLDKFCDEPDPAIALFQKEHLIQYAEWLEDDTAMSLLKKVSF